MAYPGCYRHSIWGVVNLIVEFLTQNLLALGEGRVYDPQIWCERRGNQRMVTSPCKAIAGHDCNANVTSVDAPEYLFG